MSRLQYRPDIDGLRAAAVAGVVLFHAGLPQARGGFAGVDVFFVISGYLIASLLFLELDRTGRVDFVAFWARRTRRILPSSLLVVVAILAGAYVIASDLDFYYAARDAIYAALYIINWEQLAVSLDYFTDEGNGLYVHYWSLAVEEQFYLFLTLVFGAALGSSRFIARKLSWTSAQIAIGLLAVLGVLSFIANLVLTPEAQPVAFFGTHARIWELCLGAGVGLLERGGWTPGAPARSALAWSGMVAIALTFLLYDAQEIAYPGIYAALPTAGAAFYILAGINARNAILPIPLRLCATLIPVAIGKLSYALYLWHWPVFELYQDYFGSWTTLDRAIALGVTILLSIASYVLVENPIRFSRWLSPRPRQSLAAALAVTLAIVLLAGVLERRAGGQYIVLASGAAFDPLRAKQAHKALGAYSCNLSFKDTQYKTCNFGRPNSARRIFLIGDSHAMHWLPAVERVAKDLGFAVYSRTKSACITAPIAVFNGKLGRHYYECEEWRERVFQEIEQVKPELVLIGLSSRHRPLRPGTDEQLEGGERLAALAEAERKMIARITATGARVGLFADTPWLPENPLECLSTHKNELSQCRWEEKSAIQQNGFPWSLKHERPPPGVGVLDLRDQFCWDGYCHAATARFVIIWDGHHMTRAFSASLSRVLAQRLAPLLETNVTQGQSGEQDRASR